jgi:hypothetical protein
LATLEKFRANYENLRGSAILWCGVNTANRQDSSSIIL